MVKQLGILWVPGVWQSQSMEMSLLEIRWPATRRLHIGRNLLALLKGPLLTLFCWLLLIHVLLLSALATHSYMVQNKYLESSNQKIFSVVQLS